MAKANTPTVYTADTLAVGLATIPVEALTSAPPEDTNPRGIVLSNERTKVTLMVGDKPIIFTVGLYVQREPLSDDESDKVAAISAERDAKKAARTREEQDRLAREKQAAFQLGQSSSLEMLRNIETLHSAARALNKLS